MKESFGGRGGTEGIRGAIRQQLLTLGAWRFIRLFSTQSDMLNIFPKRKNRTIPCSVLIQKRGNCHIL